MRSRFVVPFAVAVLAVPISTGCGGGSDCGPDPRSVCGAGAGGGVAPNEVPGGQGAGGAGGQCLMPAQDGTPVMNAPRSPPAVSGGTLAVLKSGVVVIGDSDRDEVHFVDSSWASTHVKLSQGDEPGRIVEGPAGSVFVALRNTRQVAQIDPLAGTVTRFEVCAAPRGLAWRPELSQLLVACADGELATVDFSSPTPVRSVQQTGEDLRDVVVLNGQVLLSTFRSPRVLALQANGALSTWSQPLGKINGPQSFSPKVAWRMVATASSVVMVHQLEETTAIPAAAPCISPYGDDGKGQPPLVPALSILTPGATEGLGKLPNEALPVDVAVTSDGTGVAVAMLGSRTVHVMSAAAPGSFFPIPLDSEPVAVGFTGPAEHPLLLVYSREPARLSVFNDARSQIAEIPLSSVSMADTGHLLFHRQTANGIACASCHPEAGDDGNVWDLSAGFRRTPSLRGGLKGTEPFHWNGEEADMGALVADVLVLRMGGPPEPYDNSNALLDWIDVQPVRPAPADLDPSAVTRGGASFQSLGCTSCHMGALGTNNGMNDVGTGELLQVPRLVDMAYRAPYFHDGSVATLEDRFTALGGWNHTATSGLSAAQISDLVAYLKSR